MCNRFRMKYLKYYLRMGRLNDVACAFMTLFPTVILHCYSTLITLTSKYPERTYTCKENLTRHTGLLMAVGSQPHQLDSSELCLCVCRCRCERIDVFRSVQGVLPERSSGYTASHVAEKPRSASRASDWKRSDMLLLTLISTGEEQTRSVCLRERDKRESSCTTLHLLPEVRALTLLCIICTQGHLQYKVSQSFLHQQDIIHCHLVLHKTLRNKQAGTVH